MCTTIPVEIDGDFTNVGSTFCVSSSDSISSAVASTSSSSPMTSPTLPQSQRPSSNKKPIILEDERRIASDILIKVYDTQVPIDNLIGQFSEFLRATRSRLMFKDTEEQSLIVWNEVVDEVAGPFILLEKSEVSDYSSKQKRKSIEEPIERKGGKRPRSDISECIIKQQRESIKAAIKKKTVKRKQDKPKIEWSPKTYQCIGRKLLRIDDPSEAVIAAKRKLQVDTTVVSKLAKRDTSTYHVYIPEECTNGFVFDQSIKCRGCEQEFCSTTFADKLIVEPDYFNHCAESCDSYLKLDLRCFCHECKLIFIEPKQLDNHYRHVHENSENEEPKEESSVDIPRRPSWMSKKLYKNRWQVTPNDTKPCPGCKKLLPYYTYHNKKGHPTIQYLIHCIQDCEEYKKLNLIETCTSCNCKFLNMRSLIQHQIQSNCERDNTHVTVKRNDKWPPCPSWMDEKYYRTRCYNGGHTKPCPGCDKPLPISIVTGKSKPLIHYIVHCIEECEEYKKLNLIKTCSTCKCKFINQASLGAHKTNCF